MDILSNLIKPPSLFQVELTNYCNLDCAMCARSMGLKRPIGHMDIDLFKEIVDQSTFYKMPIHWFHHFGEPLIYPKLREALAYFKEKGTGNGAISTNAVLLNEEKADILLENSKYILCCLDSMDPDAYRSIRNNPHFEKVKSNIAHLISERDKRNTDCKIVIQFLRTKHNHDEDITMMMDHFGSHQNVKYIEKRTDKHPKGEDITVFSEYDTEAAKRQCQKIKSELCILWSGECLPCCWDADGDQIIGNVTEQRLADIWQGHQHKQMQQHLASGDYSDLPLCEKCSGPVSDADFGVIEQVNAWVSQWVAEKAKVVLAPACPSMNKLLETTRLKEVNPVAFCDAQPDLSRPDMGIPVLPYAALEEIKPDVVFIFSPRYSSEIYFQQRHLRDRGIRLVTLGGHLD